MDNRDVWLSAKVLVDQHGDEATIHAAMRSDELLDAGDVDGAATWRRVIVAIKELKNTAPSGAVN